MIPSADPTPFYALIEMHLNQIVNVRLMTCKYVNYNPTDANYTNPGNDNKCISMRNELC